MAIEGTNLSRPEQQPQLMAPNEMVDQPAKLLRIAGMVRQMLDEVRRAPVDEDGRKMLRDIHIRSIGELKQILSDDLKRELDEITIPFDQDVPTESEIRVSQAQLMGWLEGLFHGIQAALWTQQMQAQQQLEGLQRQAGPKERPSGTYL
jgi:hypothetical protein